MPMAYNRDETYLREETWKSHDFGTICYVIQPDSGGPFKVGHASNLSNRIKTIQHTCHDLVVVRAVLSGGKPTEQYLHNRLSGYRRYGEWFDAKGVPLLCSILRRDERVLWGGPWTEEDYKEETPTIAEVRARFRESLLKEGVINVLLEVLKDKAHPEYGLALRLADKYGWIPSNGQ